MNKTRLTSSGFTLVELLLAVMILGFTLIGLIQVFLQGNRLADLATSKTGVMCLLQGKMEEIRNATFSDIMTGYVAGGTPGNTFDLTPLQGKGAVYLSQPLGDPNLIEIKIVGSWKSDSGRVIGGDLDLDGEVDAGETVDADGHFVSIATVISYRASR